MNEFYEQIGVDRGASAARIRQGYGQAVARLAKRRRALVEQGGDTSQLDLQRARLDEAWEVLSDPLRRRRYDALLTWSEGDRTKDPDAVWALVSDALVHPAAAVAAKLLRVTSKLAEIGQMPLAPSANPDEPPTLVPHDDDLTTPHAARLGPGRPAGPETTAARFHSQGASPPGHPAVPRLAMPAPSRPPRTTPEPALRVVDGSPGASDVIVLPPRHPPSEGGSAPRSPREEPVQPRIHALPPDQVGRLVDDLGYGGALLRAVREKLGLGVQDVSEHTRISVRYLEALEGEEQASLPSATFVRGYVREVARLYQLDADAVVAGYMRRFEG